MSLPSAATSAFDLPGAREVVGRGFELMLAATSQLRRVSLYFGALFLAFLGPLLVLGVAVVLVAPPELRDLVRVVQSGGQASGLAPIRDPEWASAFMLLMLGLYLGIAGAGLVALEGGIVGIAILAGHRLNRPITLRHALIRSRQVFWRVVRASFLLGIISSIVQVLAGGIVGVANLPGDALTIITLAVSTLVAAPFCYSQAGIVLGDVGARESIRRSVRLFRARPRTALVIALFPAVFGGMIQLWALSTGGEVLLMLGQVTNLGFETDTLHSAVTVVVLLAAITATGSLFFTLGALFAAPQVVTFLGLTHYAGGLDRAAPPAPPAPAATQRGLAPLPVIRLSPRPPMLPVRAAPAPPAQVAARRDPGAGFHWVTRPMLAAIVAGALLGLAGIALAAASL